MLWTQRVTLTVVAAAVAFVSGCSDENPVAPNDPPDPTDPVPPHVESVVVSPGAATLAGVGGDTRFEAVAFDQEGAPIDTLFTWQTSDPDVVIVDAEGSALATGFGSAEVYAMAGANADTAVVTVSLGPGPVREWIAGGSGLWGDAANWSGGEVPGVDDIAMITAAGTYTVSMNSGVRAGTLILGNESGTQTIETSPSFVDLQSISLLGGAELLAGGVVYVRRDLVWIGGFIGGIGSIRIEPGAEFHVVGNLVELDTEVRVEGTFEAHDGSGLRVLGEIQIQSGGLVDLQGNASVILEGGSLSSEGTILKRLGGESASILASSGSFYSRGSLFVEAGALVVSGGTLRGIVSIDANARLLQEGDTDINNLNSQGDGALVVGGQIDVWAVVFRHLVLDSDRVPSVRGTGGITVDQTLLWRRGTVSASGSLITEVGSRTVFEGPERKRISSGIWNIRGDVAADDELYFVGSDIRLEATGRWVQSGRGMIRGAQFDLAGELQKTGEGTLTVEASLSCSGTLDLRAGTLAVEGAFELLETGLITGGGTAEPTMNTRLILPGFPTAIMRGTIRPDLDGQPARLDIDGYLGMEPECRIELDVSLDGPMDTESVSLMGYAQRYGGTLALNVVNEPDQGSEYKVIYADSGIGNFESIAGAEQFAEIIHDWTGVICRR